MCVTLNNDPLKSFTLLHYMVVYVSNGRDGKSAEIFCEHQSQANPCKSGSVCTSHSPLIHTFWLGNQAG